jgi:hypothetical protein
MTALLDRLASVFSGLLVGLALLWAVPVHANTPGPRCTSWHTFLGEAPDDKEPGWHDRAQGLTHDDRNWYLSQNDGGHRPRLWRVPVRKNLAADVECGVDGVLCRSLNDFRTAGFWVGGTWWRVDQLMHEGYVHFGDTAYDEEHGPIAQLGGIEDKLGSPGYVFAPIQDTKGERRKNAIIAAFRTPDLQLAAIGQTPHFVASWLAAGRSGEPALYTSDWEDVTAIRRYAYDPAILPRAELHLTELLPVPLVTPLGYPYPVKYVQGGAISDGGDFLYLSLGFTKGENDDDDLSPDHDGNRGGIRVFELSDPTTGGPCTDLPGHRCKATLIESSTNTDADETAFRYRYNSKAPDKDEPEGMTWWDLDQVPEAHPNVRRGQVHALLLDRDESWLSGWEDDSVNVKHYAADLECSPEAVALRVEGETEAHDQLGRAFATGDFNGDGYPDLAVQANGEALGGGVSVVYGSEEGLTPRSQLFHQDTPGIPGDGASGGGFGRALVAGDFDQDGWDDLAIGVPDASIGGRARAGRIVIVYGGRAGLRMDRAVEFHQWTPHVNGSVESEDRFGASLASGDFDRDGYSDLIVGVPDEALGSTARAGMIHVFYGSRSGLSAQRETTIHEASAGVADHPHTDDRFGWSVASADLNRDGYDDVAVGVPWADPAGVRDAGAVHVLWGSGSGLGVTAPNGATAQHWHQGLPIADDAEPYDRFGYALAAGDFNRDRYVDLAVGVPYEDVGSVVDAGAVNVLHGGYGGLRTTGNQIWSQESYGIHGGAEYRDRFGYSLAAADFDGDGTSDLAVGVPFEAIGSVIGAGMVNVLYGHWYMGLSSSKTWYLHQGQRNLVPDQVEPHDWFAYALAAADFTGDGRSELVVGAPREDLEDRVDGEHQYGGVYYPDQVYTNAGLVHVIQGSYEGLMMNGSKVLHQGQ